MTELSGLLNLLAPFFGLIAVGFACGRLVPQPEGATGWLQFFLVYVALPCLLFKLISDKPVDEIASWRFILGTTSATAAAFALSFAIGLRATGDMAQAVVQGVAGSYANVGYMGPPLVLAALGPEANAPVALVLVFDNLFIFSVVPLMMAIAGAERGSLARTLREIAVGFATHPFNIAALAGVAVGAAHVGLPLALDRTVGWAAQAAAPTALFLLGIVVGSRPLERLPADVPLVIGVKLLGHPVLVLLFLWGLGVRGEVWTFAAVTMAALPPALNIFVIAAQYRTGMERASAAVLVGTVASVVTLTAVLWLVKTGRMPHG